MLLCDFLITFSVYAFCLGCLRVRFDMGMVMGMVMRYELWV